MAFRYSEKIRNAGLDARVEAVGRGAQLRLFDASNKKLITIELPEGWMTAAENGVIRKNGIWAGYADQKGEAKSFAICDSAGTAHMSGDIPYDMTLDNPHLEKGQGVMVGTFVIASGNGNE